MLQTGTHASSDAGEATTGNGQGRSADKTMEEIIAGLAEQFPQTQAEYQKKPVYRVVKRVFDFVVSLLALIALSPLFLVIVLLVRRESHGPAIYKHQRVGRNGKPLNLYKFRSMYNDDRPLEEIFTKEQMEQYRREFKVDDDPRITKIGKFLRRTSIDELPQLVNILKGELSLVGPRPITEDETLFFGEKRALYLGAIPGLTGYWQVSGRGSGDTTYQTGRRQELELYYVTHASIGFDIKILFSTVSAVVKGDGAR